MNSLNTRFWHARTLCALVLGLASAACNSVLAWDDLQVEDLPAMGGGAGEASANNGGSGGSVGAPECTTHQQCLDLAGRAADGTQLPARCIQPEGKCVQLLSADCDAVTGDYTDDDAILIGSLFSTKGAQAATNLQRQQSAMLAVEQINKAGGIPAPNSGRPRSLVLVSCDESTDLIRAGTHLSVDLKVPAIVGPNTSQDTLDVSNEVTVPSGTVVMTPTGVASSIADLIDQNLTYLMTPTDVQRAPLMIRQINELETSIKEAQGKSNVKLAVVYRDDALGIGTRTSLNSLVINGKPLADPINLGQRVAIHPYDFSKPDQAEIISSLVEFAPDIVVLAGTAEIISAIMQPLESAWTSDSLHRPEYVLIDSAKVTDLLMITKENDDLRRRVRGTGITPAPTSAPVFDAFKVDYQVRYPGKSIVSGMGATYDATYAIAFALAATKDQPVSGASVAEGFKKIRGGSTLIEIGSTKVLAAFQKLASGEAITAIGTFAPLEWNESGAVVGSTLEVWCIGAPAGSPVYQSSGLTFDIKTQQQSGTYTQCGP